MMESKMKTVTITLPDVTTIRTIGGKAYNVVWEEIPANVIAALVDGGAKIIANNVWNGGGKDATDADRLAALDKRVNAWKSGSYAIVEREGGQQLLTIAFDLWLAKLAKDNGVDVKTMNDHLAGLVKEAFGKDAKLSADNKVNVVCASAAKEAKTEASAERATWDDTWLPLAEAKLADEAAAKAKLDVSAIKLTLK